MKISREARNTAKKLFSICRQPEGGVDETKVREVIKYVEGASIRNPVGILTHFQRLISLELQANTALIESSATLTDSERQELKTKLQTVFGPSTEVAYTERPELLGGLRIKHGSSVWDASVLGRLNELQKTF